MTENNTNLKGETTENVENQKAPQKQREGQAPASGVKTKKRPDPTRYGDWERNGRCIDF